MVREVTGVDSEALKHVAPGGGGLALAAHSSSSTPPVGDNPTIPRLPHTCHSALCLPRQLSYAVVEGLLWLGVRDIVIALRKSLKLPAMTRRNRPRVRIPHGYLWSPTLLPKPKGGAGTHCRAPTVRDPRCTGIPARGHFGVPVLPARARG